MHEIIAEAASKQKVDQTYTRTSQEFRNRITLLLEATLRMAVTLKSYSLALTVIQAVQMFKIGCYANQKEWYGKLMIQTYQCLPRLRIQNVVVETKGGEKMATRDPSSIQLDLVRVHAEAFTKHNFLMFQQQGIDPRMALRSYREGWWFFLRAEPMDGNEGETDPMMDIQPTGMLQLVDETTLNKFRTAPFQDRLVTAFPVVVQNVAQVMGKIRIPFLAPSVPGKYKMTTSVQSQEFLGADQEFSFDVRVWDASTVEATSKVSEFPGSTKEEAEETASAEDGKEK